jgi:drug/metabolite transporter (DMT)-like permease
METKALSPQSATGTDHPYRSVSLTGLFFAACAAIGYTTANAFLRWLAGDETPAEWVVTCKASCTAAIFLPWLVVLGFRNVKLFPPLKICGLLLFAAVLVQVFGNLAFQWSLSQIGMAFAVPILMSCLVISGATLGRVFLNEPVSKTMCVAITLFVVSVFALGLGVKSTESDSTDVGVWPLLGAVAAGLSGFAFAVLGVSIRTSMKYKIPSATPMVFVGLTGALLLGGVTYQNYGVSILQTTTGPQWFGLLAAALSNSIAFLCLTKAFKRLPVVYVNATNVAQTGMAAVIGLIYFQEPFTYWLMLGLLIMLAAFYILGRQQVNARKNISVKHVSA